ncbi:MAG: hypothetical protein ACN4GZ_09650 [Acidimicrobiales bacterium]
MIRRQSIVQLTTVALAALIAASCTNGSSVETANPTTDPPTTTTSEPADTASTTTTTEASTQPTPPESMPGDVIEFGPGAGDQIAVVGVAHDDMLNVRIAPGTEFDIIDTLDPLADEVIALGENRLLTSSFWVEIETATGPGWVNEAFVGFLGVSQESTSDAVAASGGPVAVGELLAQTYASVDPPSTVTLVDDSGDTVVYDVVGIGDDSVKGFRLAIVTESVSGGTGVASFTEHTICSRGLAQDLRCV